MSAVAQKSVDLRCFPYVIDKEFKFIMVAPKVRNLTIDYHYSQDPKAPHRAIRFLTAGHGGPGSFAYLQTNEEEIRDYVMGTDYALEGNIEEVDHDDLGRRIFGIDGEGIVHAGSISSRAKQPAPKSPDEQPPSTPKAARAPRVLS